MVESCTRLDISSRFEYLLVREVFMPKMSLQLRLRFCESETKSDKLRRQGQALLDLGLWTLWTAPALGARGHE